MEIEILKSFFQKERLSLSHLEKLKKIGIKDVEQLIALGKENLVFLLGVSEETAERILKAGWKAYKPVFKTATEMREEEEKIGRMETPIQRLNEVLGGGFEYGSLVELYGPFASGKSQYLFTQSVLEAGKGNFVIFIDTEGTFRYERIRQIAEARGIGENSLSSILVKKAASSSELILIIHHLLSLIPKMKEEGKSVSLIAIDSIMNVFRSDYVGISELATRQQKLNWCLRTLLNIARANDLVVVYSNQVVGSPSSPIGWIAAGGHVMAHMSTIRISLHRRGSKRMMRIEDAPHLPKYEIWFKITERGVEDA